MRRGGIFGALVVLAFLCARREARASDLRVERDEGAEACPSPSAFEARAREAHAASSRDLTIRFSRTQTGYASFVRTADGMVRTLDDASCEALADATLVVVRLALEEPPASEPVAPPRPSPEATAPPAFPPRPSPSPVGIRGELLAGAAGALGLQNAPSAGVRGAGALVFVRGHASLGITGMWLAPVTHDVESGTVEIGLLGGGLEGCGRTDVGSVRLSLALCARAEAFRLSGVAVGFVRSESRVRPLLAASLALRAKIRMSGPLGLFGELAATVPLANERFSVEGAGIVYDSPAVAGNGAAGLALDFE